MGISLGSNVDSLKAQRRLAQIGDQLSRIFERLSSGRRINRASDDPAGLAIAESLRASQRVAAVAIRNANDGISMVHIADSALGQMSEILIRMAELAQQSANGVYSPGQRAALALEFEALGSEIDRIAATTKFNGISLLTGNGGSVSIQVGFDAGAFSQIPLPAVAATLSAFGLTSGAGSALSYSINASSILEGQSAARCALEALNLALAHVANSRGHLGATESRLEVAINNLSVLKENYAAAESRIMDVDVAAEAAEMTRLLILQQVAAAVLAQVNQQPALALLLLR